MAFEFGKFLNRIVLTANFLFALLLITSGISMYISPAKFWPAAFLSISFSYILIANLVFIVFWLIQLNKWILVSAVSLLINISQISSVFQIPAWLPDIHSHKKHNEEIRIFSYNIKALNRYESKKPLVHLSEVLKIIKFENPDIICFQEFFYNKTGEQSLKNILSALKPAKYNYAFCSYFGDSQNGDGLIVISKYPILKKHKIDFANTANAAMYVDINIKGTYTRIFCVHLQSLQFIKENYEYLDSMNLSYNHESKTAIKKISSKLRNAFLHRAKQADYISGLISKSPYPVIVCGDFNDTPVSYTYNKMKKNLRDAFRESGHGVGITYHGLAPSFRIDYILFSKTFKSSKYETININYSDHYPITASLYFN